MSGLLISRRQLIPQGLAAASLASLCLPGAAQAAAYPQKTVSFIVPDSGGGTFDAYVREFSKLMQSTLKTSSAFAPVTMPGAGGQAAVFNLLNSKPDGYTMGIINVPGIISSQYRKNGAKMPLERLTWLANLGRDTYGFAVSTKSGLKTIDDVRRLAAKRPFTFSSTGYGSTDYFATRVFGTALKLNFRQILGYTGSAPTVVAVARGEVDGVVHALASLRHMEQAGLVKVIFAFQDKASIPNVEDAGTVGVPVLGKMAQWRPVAAPPGVSPDIDNTLSNAFMTSARSAEAQAWANAAGTTLFPLDAKATREMAKQQEAFVQSWAHVLA